MNAMRLRDNLYNILGNAADPRGTRYDIRLIPECFIYKAHFPGRAVTPGACLIQTAGELVEDVTGRSLEISALKNVKFLRPVEPGKERNLTFVVSRAGDDGAGGVAVRVSVESGNGCCAKLSFSMKDR